MLGFLIAIISGALMSIQGVWNAGVTKQTSIWTAAGFVQFSALTVCVIAWFISGKEKALSSLVQVSPKYFFVGWRAGRIYYLYGNQKRCNSRTGEVGHVYCDGAADCILSD